MIYHSCEGRIEKSVPLDHRLSSLGKPRDTKRRSPGRIFLSYPHMHDRFLYCNPRKDTKNYTENAHIQSD